VESGTVYPYRTLQLTRPSVAALPRGLAAERQSLCRQPMLMLGPAMGRPEQQSACAAVTRGRDTGPSAASVPMQAACTVGRGKELAAQSSMCGASVQGDPASLPCRLRPRQRFSSSRGVGLPAERPALHPNLHARPSGMKRAMRFPLARRTIWRSLPRCLVGCAQGSGLPRPVGTLRANDRSQVAGAVFSREMRIRAETLDLGFRPRPRRIWAHRVRCATVLGCVRSRPSTSTAP
jgi:hypothetical protein